MFIILVNKYNYILVKVSGWMFIFIIGMLIGIVIFGILVDKIGWRKIFVIYYIGGIVYCFIYFFLFIDLILLLWGSVLFGFFVNGMMGGFGVILVENYFVEVCFIVENFIFGIGCGLVGFGFVIIGLFVIGGNLFGVLFLIFIIYLIGLIIMLLCVLEIKGKVLD